MARQIIQEIASAVKSGFSANTTEELCRYEVASSIEIEDRLPLDEEIEDIVEPIVKDESFVVAFETIEDGIANLTEFEFDNLNEDEKVIDRQGNKFVVCSGVIYPVVISKSFEVSRIASAISSDIRVTFNAICAYDETSYDFDSFHVSLDSKFGTVCPVCSSENVSPVWHEDKHVVCHCHDCLADFETPMDVEDSSTEEITTVERDLGDGIVGMTYFAPDFGWIAEIWDNDTLIDQIVMDNPSEADEYFDCFVEQYESIEPGEILRSVETGAEFTVDDVCGKEVVAAGKFAKRTQIAISKAKGKLISDKSNVFDSANVYAGSYFVNANGDKIEVLAVDGSVVTYNELYTEKNSGLARNEFRECSKKEFSKLLLDGNYVATCQN